MRPASSSNVAGNKTEKLAFRLLFFLLSDAEEYSMLRDQRIKDIKNRKDRANGIANATIDDEKSIEYRMNPADRQMTFLSRT